MKATDAIKLRSNIQRVLRGLGNTNGTKLPSTKSNSGEVALQLWLWRFVKRMVNGMEADATKEAIRAGVLFDHKANPLPEGTQKQTYTSDVVDISVMVKRASQMLNQDVLKANLRKLKLTQEQIDNAFDTSMEYKAAPHEFSVVLVETD